VSVERLAELIRERRPCVVLTGAGVSTESGIPDFRSPAGIWAQFDPMEYASIDAFRRDPAKVWTFYSRRLDVLARAEPNAAHHALARLECDGWVTALITQNIDMLHGRAGSSAVVEVHGSIRTSSCLACYTRVPLDEVVRLLDGQPAPPCPTCGSILKPDVVMFGEPMPRVAMERAYELARSAALMLVVGSSLEVWPVAGLPLEAASFAIVNRGPTALDGEAVLTIDAPAGETLTALAEELGSAAVQASATGADAGEQRGET
jgi:NAD-dependent protein deacetylase/lipoamidase